MRASLFIALRYVFSRKRKTAIHLISLISVVGISLGTAALIVVLSVFGGFAQLIEGLYDRVDPDLKITPALGKYIESDSLYHSLKGFEEIQFLSKAYEEKALFTHGEEEYVAKVLGVDSHYFQLHPFQDYLRYGSQFDPNNYEVLIGQGLAYYLNYSLSRRGAKAIEIHLPVDKDGLSIRPDQAFSIHKANPSGVFQIQGEFDGAYALMDLNLLQNWTNQYNRYSWLEVELKEGIDAKGFKNELQHRYGSDYVILDRGEQHAFLTRVMAIEKWAVYLIFTFILFIATFNLIGSLAMVILDKRKEIFSLQAMGANLRQVRAVFWWQGMLMSSIGGLVGAVLGSLIAWGQETYGWVQMGNGGNFLVNAYPVDLNFQTVLLGILTVWIMGGLSALIPVKRIKEMI